MVDETYIRIKGVWHYLYRGIDEDGNLVDVRSAILILEIQLLLGGISNSSPWSTKVSR